MVCKNSNEIPVMVERGRDRVSVSDISNVDIFVNDASPF
jgi:hypothetical protein